MLKNIRSKSRVGGSPGGRWRETERWREDPLISACAMGLYNSSLLKCRDTAKPWRLLPCCILVTSRVPGTSREAGDSKCYGIRGLTFYIYRSIMWLCPVTKHCVQQLQVLGRAARKGCRSALKWFSLSLAVRLFCGHLLWVSRLYLF